jgi:IS30 family transposase
MKPLSRRWTVNEKAELDRLLDAGKEAAEIAAALNRTRQAIYARLQRLDVKRMRSSQRMVDRS